MKSLPIIKTCSMCSQCGTRETDWGPFFGPECLHEKAAKWHEDNRGVRFQTHPSVKPEAPPPDWCPIRGNA